MTTPAIPPHILDAASQLGWQIIGQPHLHPEGPVYLCRDAAGLHRPTIELSYRQRFFNVLLRAAGVSPAQASALAPSLSRSAEVPS